MSTTASTCQLFATGCLFLGMAAKANLGPVIVGGALGGLLQPTYDKLSRDQPDPEPRDYLWNTLLGVAAAGITVYVAADSKHDDAVRLFFFAIVCGLAFPSVLASAVNSLPKRAEAVQQDIVKITKVSQSNDVATTEKAATNLRETLANNPAGTIGSRGASIVDTGAQAAVQNIAETAKRNLEAAPEVINQLQQVGAVAQTAGYLDTAKATAQQLTKLSRTDIGEALQSIALNAARQILDQQPPNDAAGQI